ncbi:MAG: FAD-dependent monooxygenase [Nocardiopsaceae bacterium]|nr:FAD-dependent monooxygenase [Nocardiopsaceae bacterium]
MTMMPEHDAEVVIAGAGPAGLWLAAELRLAGVPTIVLEQAPERGPYTRGLGVHARTLEVLAMRGAADTLVRQGRKMPRWHFGMLPSLVDFSVLDTPFPFVLAYPQPLLEDLLERRATELGTTVLRGYTVTGLSQDESSVRIEAACPSGPRAFTASFAVGCDGAHSTVREAAGIGFPGTDSSLFGYLGDVTLDAPPEHGTVTIASRGGTLIIAPLPDGRFRVSGFDPKGQDPGVTLTINRLRASVQRAAGRDFGLRDATWMSRFGNATRQAENYRSGRVLLAGDAAHIHMPAGGVGLNVAVQDAMNLGWKLAAVVQDRAADDLLDTYHAERHPVGADLLNNTLAQTALIAAFSAEGLALRDVLADLMNRTPDMSAHLAADMSGLAVSYPPADLAAHPLTGQRAPDQPADGTSLFPLLADGRAVLLDFRGTLDRAVKTARDLGIPTRTADAWPGQHDVGAAIIRPDGYVWWATEHADDTVTAALHALGARFP